MLLVLPECLTRVVLSAQVRQLPAAAAADDDIDRPLAAPWAADSCLTVLFEVLLSALRSGLDKLSLSEWIAWALTKALIDLNLLILVVLFHSLQGQALCQGQDHAQGRSEVADAPMCRGRSGAMRGWRARPARRRRWRRRRSRRRAPGTPRPRRGSWTPTTTPFLATAVAQTARVPRAQHGRWASCRHPAVVHMLYLVPLSLSSCHAIMVLAEHMKAPFQ